VITAVDTSVLLDVFAGDARYGPRSREALRACRSVGALIACDIVWAEIVAAFPTEAVAGEAMAQLDVALDPIDQEAAATAGRSWREYRQRGGKRTRVIADFLIAGHATMHADRLLTRDRGFTREYFRDIAIVDPTDR
jgi:predicted nucleic acid-binding protein